MEIIDNSKNELSYYSEFPIIYLADFYFSEHYLSKKIKRKMIKNHVIKNHIYCNNSDINTNKFFMNRFKSSLKIKPESELLINKIVLTSKISYSNIK